MSQSLPSNFQELSIMIKWIGEIFENIKSNKNLRCLANLSYEIIGNNKIQFTIKSTENQMMKSIIQKNNKLYNYSKTFTLNTKDILFIKKALVLSIDKLQDINSALIDEFNNEHFENIEDLCDYDKMKKSLEINNMLETDPITILMYLNSFYDIMDNYFMHLLSSYLKKIK